MEIVVDKKPQSFALAPKLDLAIELSIPCSGFDSRIGIVVAVAVALALVPNSCLD